VICVNTFGAFLRGEGTSAERTAPAAPDVPPRRPPTLW
jgi:hypothetical protein